MTSKKWEKFPSSPQINFLKEFTIFETDTEWYAQIDKKNYRAEKKINFQALNELTDTKIEDGKLKGNLKTSHSVQIDEYTVNVKNNITTVRPGVVKGTKILEEKKDSELFVMLLAQLFREMQDKNSLILNYLTAKINYATYDVSRKKKIEQELEKCGIKDLKTQGDMWFDQSYGFREVQSFNNWMRIVYLGKTRIKTYMTGYFELEKKQMECLVDKKSWLQSEIDKELATLNDKFKQYCPDEKCGVREYAILQWAGSELTEMVGKPQYVRSYKDLNTSILFNYEFNYYSPQIKLDFPTADRLLSLEGKETSLFNFENAEYLSQNQKEPNKLKDRFKLKNEKEGKELGRFYQGVFQSFIQVSENPKFDYLKAFYGIRGYLQSFELLSLYTYNNITMRALQHVYQQNKDTLSCFNYFRQFESVICNSNTLSLDKYSGIVTWIIAYFQEVDKEEEGIKDWDAREYIIKELDITPQDFTSIIIDSGFQRAIKQIQDSFVEEYGCFKPGPCPRKFLAERQWYSGKITNVPHLYPTLDVRSVAQFPGNIDLLQNQVPEIYGFYNIHHNFTGKIFGGEEDVIFSSNSGSFNNVFQLLLMQDLSREGRTSDLAHFFNIWSPSSYLVEYLDHLFFEWFFGGLFGSQNIGKLLFGRTSDSALLIVKQIPLLDGGKPDIDPVLSLGLIPSSMRPKVSQIEILNGEGNKEDFTRRGNILKWDDSDEITNEKKSFYDPPQKIKGTLLPITAPLNFHSGIYIYDDDQKKNLHFNLDGDFSDLQLKATRFVWDNSTFWNDEKQDGISLQGINDLSNLHPYPILTSLPFFLNGKYSVHS